MGAETTQDMPGALFGHGVAWREEVGAMAGRAALISGADELMLRGKFCSQAPAPFHSPTTHPVHPQQLL